MSDDATTPETPDHGHQPGDVIVESVTAGDPLVTDLGDDTGNGNGNGNGHVADPAAEINGNGNGAHVDPAVSAIYDVATRITPVSMVRPLDHTDAVPSSNGEYEHHEDDVAPLDEAELRKARRRYLWKRVGTYLGVLLVVLVVVGGAGYYFLKKNEQDAATKAPTPTTTVPRDPRVDRESGAVTTPENATSGALAGVLPAPEAAAERAKDREENAQDSDEGAAATPPVPGLPTPVEARKAGGSEDDADTGPSSSGKTKAKTESKRGDDASPAPAPATATPKPQSSPTPAAASSPGPTGPRGAQGARGERGERGPGVKGLTSARVFASGKVESRQGDFPSVKRRQDGLYCLYGPTKLAVITATLDATAKGAPAVATATTAPGSCGSTARGFIRIQSIDGTGVNRPFFAVMRLSSK